MPYDPGCGQGLTRVGWFPCDLAHSQAISVIAIAGCRRVLGEPSRLIERQSLGLASAWSDARPVAAVVVLVRCRSGRRSRARARSWRGPAQVVAPVERLLNRPCPRRI